MGARWQRVEQAEARFKQDLAGREVKRSQWLEEHDTTADYGPDACEFAKGKPRTLISGSELLYMLGKHGHKARIDLKEARTLAAENEKAFRRLGN
jgi:hypothetical protein